MIRNGISKSIEPLEKCFGVLSMIASDSPERVDKTSSVDLMLVNQLYDDGYINAEYERVSQELPIFHEPKITPAGAAKLAEWAVILESASVSGKTKKVLVTVFWMLFGSALTIASSYLVASKKPSSAAYNITVERDNFSATAFSLRSKIAPHGGR